MLILNFTMALSQSNSWTVMRWIKVLWETDLFHVFILYILQFRFVTQYCKVPTQEKLAPLSALCLRAPGLFLSVTFLSPV